MLLVLSSPSGAGKTTLARRLMAADTGPRMSVSVTTRKPRPGEEEGSDYFFVDEAEFKRMGRPASCSNGRACSTTTTARRGRR